MQRLNGVFNATSGFGHDIAVRLDELGFTVFAGCLHPGGHGAKKLKSSSSNNLHIVPVDVGNDDSVLKAHQYVVENLPPNGMYHLIPQTLGVSREKQAPPPLPSSPINFCILAFFHLKYHISNEKMQECKS